MFIYCYGFRGKFYGAAEYEYDYPTEGVIYNCILFMRQELDVLRLEFAEQECEKYGFSSTSEWKGNPLRVEALNSSGMQKFSGHYEEAMEIGSALAIYPNT